MKILALDSSSAPASCAVLEDDFLLGEFMIHTSTTHSQTLLPMVESLLKQCETSLDEIDLFAVTSGPGSFTGVRIGIATVKGLAFAQNKPCVGVSTLHSLALNVRLFQGLVVPLMDARRSQVYTAIFRSDTHCVERVTEDQAISIEELATLLSHNASNQPVLILGDGAALHFSYLSNLMDNLTIAPESLRYQRASSIGLIALQRAQENRTVSSALLEPTYLRLPQAERERLEHLKSKEVSL